MTQILSTLRPGPDHPQVADARLRLLQVSFRLFGCISFTGAFVFAWAAFELGSTEGGYQSALYFCISLVLLCVKPRRVAWAWVPCALVAVIAIKSSIDNSIMFGVAGSLFVGMTAAIWVSALAGLVSLTAVYLTFAALTTVGVIAIDLAALVRMPIYWFIGSVFIVSIGLLIQRLNAALEDKDEVNQQLADTASDLKATKQALERRVSQNQEIFGIISHELRTPASSIELIATSTDSLESQRRALQRNSARLLRTLGDMRMIVDPNAVVPISEDRVDLPELLSELSNQWAGLLARTKVALDVQIADGAKAPVLTDEFRLSMIVNNLVRNACLHSEGNQISVRILRESQKLAIYVDDNGKGIPGEHAERLFEAWSRGDTRSDGTGLGLTIALRSCTELKGHLSFAGSRLGGACFKIELPWTPAESAAVNEGVTQDFGNSLKTLSVLIVDDDPDIAHLTGRELRNTLDNVTFEISANRALQILLETPPDVLISDYFMPEMDGAELVRLARANGFKGWVVAATGAVLYEGVHPMLEAGADCLIEKPVKAQNLVDLFDEFTQSTHQGALAKPA